MPPLRLLLADDHAMMRAGLKALIDPDPHLQIVGEANDGQDALDLYERLRPDLVILDIAMPGMNGIHVAERLKRLDPTAKIIILSAHGDPIYLRRALSAGASGYVHKRSIAEMLFIAIRAVAEGGIYVDPSIAGSLATILTEKKVVRGQREGRELSEREREVLLRVAQGYTNKQVADQLEISVKTVESHKGNIAEKLGLTGRSEFARYALQQGWLQDS